MSEEQLPPLTPGERRAIERELDRIEDRLREAPVGLHVAGPPASEAALQAAAAAGLPERARMLWARFDGLDLGHGEARIYALDELESQSAALSRDGRARPGDLAIGVYGRDDLVACSDPWEEGADVILVDEGGQRGPYASSAEGLVLGLLGELSVLLDDGGEYHEELFGEDGELTPAAERRLLRRHLDLDEDAPLPRFRLAQLLRREGEARAARRELELCLRRAPEFAWAHFELGRACLDLGAREDAERAFRDAAAKGDDALLVAYFQAWQALASPKAARKELGSAVVAANPGFVRAQEAGAREALEDGFPGRARELVALGLAVAPGDVALLDLRRHLDQS